MRGNLNFTSFRRKARVIHSVSNTVQTPSNRTTLLSSSTLLLNFAFWFSHHTSILLGVQAHVVSLATEGET